MPRIYKYYYGTTEGGKKTFKTNLAKYGADFYKRIGAKGGMNGHTGGFYANRELARVAGAKAGQISKIGKKYLGEEHGYRKYLDKNTGKVVKFPV